jgi:hypothetical protein
MTEKGTMTSLPPLRWILAVMPWLVVGLLSPHYAIARPMPMERYDLSGEEWQTLIAAAEALGLSRSAPVRETVSLRQSAMGKRVVRVKYAPFETSARHERFDELTCEAGVDGPWACTRRQRVHFALEPGAAMSIEGIGVDLMAPEEVTEVAAFGAQWLALHDLGAPYQVEQTDGGFFVRAGRDGKCTASVAVRRVALSVGFRYESLIGRVDPRCYVI